MLKLLSFLVEQAKMQVNWRFLIWQHLGVEILETNVRISQRAADAVLAREIEPRMFGTQFKKRFFHHGHLQVINHVRVCRTGMIHTHATARGIAHNVNRS